MRLHPGLALAGGVAYGIRSYDTDGKIEGVEVLNIRNPSGTGVTGTAISPGSGITA